MSQRFTWIVVVTLLAAAALILRLHRLQVREHERWADLAIDQRGGIFTLPGERGRILDRNGIVLAEDEAVIDVSVEPSAFRELSVLHALADALVLGSEVPDAEAVRWRCFTNPAKAVEDLSRIRAPQLEELVLRMQPLVPPRGTLPLRADEGPQRWKRCLRLLGVELPQAQDRGEWIQREGMNLAARCGEELKLLSDLARVRGADLPAFLGELKSLSAREEAWKQGQIRRELREVAALDAFGVPSPDLEKLGGETWREMVCDAALPFADEDAASRALAESDAWLSGSIALPWALAAALGDRDAVEVARLAKLGAQDPDELLDHWAQSVGLNNMDPELRRRRERDLRGRWRRGRAFPFATALPSEARLLFTGPGRLESKGFRIEPRLTRRSLPATAATSTLGLLLGGVARQSGEPTLARSVEADRHDALRASAGQVASGTPGGVLLTAPRHGQDVRLSLDWDLQQAVERALDVAHETEPMALVLLDPATGAIRALVTAPVSKDRDAALHARLVLEEERTVLRRILGRGEGWARQRLLALSDSGAGSASEAALLERWQGSAPLELRRRLDGVGEALAMSPAFHRAVDIPEHLPPGSVFKAITVLAAIESGKMNPESVVECVQTTERAFLRCKGHGSLSARKALQVSCNAWCYEAGERLGIEAFVDWFQRLGLGEPVPGLLPRERRLFQEIASDDARALAIGGGSLRIAPVRAAALAASLATGLRVTATFLHGPTPSFAPLRVGAATLSLVRAGMRDVVLPGGTAGQVAGLQHFRIAAKTGTADYEASGGERLNQAWFVGYAPADPGETPRIAFAAVRAHTHDKGADAAPLVARALEALARTHPGERWW